MCERLPRRKREHFRRQLDNAVRTYLSFHARLLRLEHYSYVREAVPGADQQLQRDLRGQLHAHVHLDLPLHPRLLLRQLDNPLRGFLPRRPSHLRRLLHQKMREHMSGHTRHLWRFVHKKVCIDLP